MHLSKSAKLSEHIDYIDQQFNYSDFDDDDEPELDSETELAYGIDDMTWLDASEGLASFQAVRAKIAADGLAGVDTDEVTDLLAELDDCISVLNDSALRGGKFHLSLVE